MLCQGITITGKQCSRKSKNDSYCHQHSPERKSYMHEFRQQKPAECVVCYESLENQKHSLQCGHWIHKNCIVQSAKEECPVCRSKVDLGVRARRKIEKIARERYAQQIIEEQNEIRQELQHQISDLLAPNLRRRLTMAITTIGDTEDPDARAAEIINDIFDDPTYQAFLQTLLSGEYIDSESDSNAESDSDSGEYTVIDDHEYQRS